MTVKTNQRSLWHDIQALFKTAAARDTVKTPVQSLCAQRVQAVGDLGQGLEIRYSQMQEVGHGRIETRILEAIQLPPDGSRLDWPFAQQIFQLQRHTRHKKSGLTRSDIVYGVTNLSAAQAGPETLLKLNRGHWSIENRSHWVRDVTFNEDRSAVRCQSIPQLMAALRNVVIGVMRITGHTNIAAACRTNAAKPHRVIAFIQERLTFE